MLALFGAVALAALLRVLWVILQLMLAVPRRNADFELE